MLYAELGRKKGSPGVENEPCPNELSMGHPPGPENWAGSAMSYNVTHTCLLAPFTQKTSSAFQTTGTISNVVILPSQRKP